MVFHHPSQASLEDSCSSPRAFDQTPKRGKEAILASAIFDGLVASAIGGGVPNDVDYPVHDLTLECCHHVAIFGLVLGNGRNTEIEFRFDSDKPIFNPVR